MQAIKQPEQAKTPRDTPIGYHWEYRGMGWRTVKPCHYTCSASGMQPPGYSVLPKDVYKCVSRGWEHLHYFELVEDATYKTITFKVIEWIDWVKDIERRVKEELGRNIELDDLIHSPALDPENPAPFCKHFVFDGVYENGVFVTHHSDKNSYWFIDNEDTRLMYKPKAL